MSPRKISWHGTNGVLIINNEPDGQTATLFLDYPYCAGKKAWRQLMGKGVNKCNLISDQRNTPANGPKENKKGQPSLPRVIYSHQQHCSIKLCYGISSREELQNSVHQLRRSFLPHFHFLWFCPPPPPSKHAPTAKADTVCSPGKKCWLTAQRQAYLAAWAP